MINLYSRDLSRAAAFYAELGLVETFRTLPNRTSRSIWNSRSMGSLLESRPLRRPRNTTAFGPREKGRWIEIVPWTDDTDAALNGLVAKGAPLLSPAHDFLDGKLRAAWIADTDRNPIQVVQRRN
jgi:predicted enzyme related to lactoylglutathione lyase